MVLQHILSVITIHPSLFPRLFPYVYVDISVTLSVQLLYIPNKAHAAGKQIFWCAASRQRSRKHRFIAFLRQKIGVFLFLTIEEYPHFCVEGDSRFSCGQRFFFSVLFARSVPQKRTVGEGPLRGSRFVTSHICLRESEQREVICRKLRLQAH